MSTLTKIFTVVMVVFSIAFTMTIISFVGKTSNWKSLADEYRVQQQITETHMRSMTAAQAAEHTVWLDSKKALEARIAKLEESETASLGEKAELRDELARLRAEKSDADALSRRLASQLQVAQDNSIAQRQQREDIEKRNMELERRNLDFNERVNELTAQILVLVQQQQQLEQQVNILKEENSKLARGAGAGGPVAAPEAAALGGVTPVTPTAVAPIRGKIVQVEGNLATISVGSADGVQKGMVFVIYRGSEYIGDIQVTDVEPNLAAGRLKGTRSAPQPNDMVADEPALGLAP